MKLLWQLSERLESGEKPTAKTVDDLQVPESLRFLTVCRDRRKNKWRESGSVSQSRLDGGITDNSNTQFAMLALWVAQRYGVPTLPTFDLMVERFERSEKNGRWSYTPAVDRHAGYNPSMTCVGLMALAIGRGLTITSSGEPATAPDDRRVNKALADLYLAVGVPSGQMEKPVAHPAIAADFYFLWSLERVCMLYGLPTLGDKEWYRWGAEILVTNQDLDGHWEVIRLDPKVGPPPVNPGMYGPHLRTAFALLFLKHSHPMKDLTPKLPYTALELNQGIAHVLRNPKILESTTPASSRSTGTGPDR